MTAPATMWCLVHRTPAPSGALYCECGAELVPMPILDQPQGGTDDEEVSAVRRPLSVCWLCDHQSSNASNQWCDNPKCRASLYPPDLAIVYEPYVAVALDRSAWTGLSGRESRTLLGRASDRHGYIFRPTRTVSRRHAVVEVDADGSGWITPLPLLDAPNGTWVNEKEVFGRTQLNTRDVVRFAKSGPPGTVRRPSQS